MTGAVKSAKRGFTIALSTPKINATINRVMILLVVLEAVILMPFKIHVAIASAAAFTSSLTMNLMTSIVPCPANVR
jgi:hypothetical protein